MFNEVELERLQKLACIKLDNKNRQKLLEQLANIISFLDQLKEIKIDNVWNFSQDFKVCNQLRVLPWLKKFDNIDWLLSNIKHDKTNKNIIIKSVLN